MNCRNVLFDLSMTGCGELVVLHQSTLQKANMPSPINKINYESLQNFNISEYHPLGQQFPPEKIMNLANLLTLNESQDSQAIFLLLSHTNTQVTNALKAVISKNPIFTKRFILCMRSPIAIYQVKYLFEGIYLLSIDC